jgi:hypothetical protein
MFSSVDECVRPIVAGGWKPNRIRGTMKTYTCVGDGETGKGCKETSHYSSGVMISKLDTKEEVFLCDKCAKNELEHVAN